MVTDLAVSLVTSCRPPVRPQNTPDDRTWNAGVAVRTADGSRRTADAGDEQCVSVCLSVCLGVCVFVHPRSSYLRNYTSDLCLFFLAYVTYGRGSVLLWRRSDTLCTSGFVDDVTFAHKLLDVAARLRQRGSQV